LEGYLASNTKGDQFPQSVTQGLHFFFKIVLLGIFSGRSVREPRVIHSAPKVLTSNQRTTVMDKQIDIQKAEFIKERNWFWSK
jgi:hypothetical protein